MPENRSRFVLLCQQSLAIAVVVAIAAPAADLVTLNIVAPSRPDVVVGHGAPASDPGTTEPAGGAGALGGANTPSVVSSAPVRPRVTAVPLGGVSKAGLAALSDPSGEAGDAGGSRSGTAATARLAATEGDPETDDLAVLSAPQSVDSLATVGVTWAHGDDDLPEHAITVSVRTAKNGTWSSWETMPYHDEHGPDDGSAEAARTRPGTDPVYVGHVDDVQIKAVTASGDAPEGMQLALVDPGAPKQKVVEKPAIDTGTLDLSAADTTPTTPPATPLPDPTEPSDPTTQPSDPTSDPTTEPVTDGTDSTDSTDSTDAAALAGAVTAKPYIYSRAQWGADERMRDKSSLRYGEVHAGFVHHTVNANNYTQAQVPAIIRGIYAYHTQSRGWSDVGYNFLVDRFGRIWEGRYGGVDRPVVGAHTLGYNDDAFAMSAIGNFDITQPSAAVLDAYGRLFAWKLSLHGVGAGSMRQWVTKKYLPAVNGHRDVGQTACPGRYLYAQIPKIRALAVQYQKSFAARNRVANLTGTAKPDVVLRDATTKQGYVLRSAAAAGFTSGSLARTGLAGRTATAVGDVTGDGVADLLVRNTTTTIASVYPGDGHGHFGSGRKATKRFAAADQLTGVGDWNGDGKADVVGRNATTKRLYAYYGDGTGTFGATHRTLSLAWGGYDLTIGAGDLNRDGHPDLLARGTDGRLWLVPGTGAGLGARKLLASAWKGYDLTAGGSDVTGDGKPDVVARGSSSKAVYVWPGDGQGGLGARRGPYTGFSGINTLLSPGQVGGSSAGDLVGRNAAGNLMVFTGAGASSTPKLVPTGRSFPNANLLLNVGDWNGDGKGDVMSRSTTGTMYLLKGNGDGTFSAPVTVGQGFGAVRMLAAVGDITGDGKPDLMGQPSGGSMRIYPGNGSSGFAGSYVAHAPVSGTQQVGLGLWNTDGSPDNLVRGGDGSLVLYPGNGPGGLVGGTKIGSLASGYDWLLAVGDLTGDKRADLLARAKSTGTLWLLKGTTTGFASRVLFANGMSRFDLAG